MEPNKQPPSTIPELKVQSISGYNYLGCYTDSPNRVLNASSTTLIYNEPQFCCQWCANVDTANTICGVEYGNQCFCDTTFPNAESASVEAGNHCFCHTAIPSAESASASDCNLGCFGDGSVACGGAWRLNIYSSMAPATIPARPKTVTARLLEGYSYFGCYSDSSDRILRGTDTTPSLNDPQYCCQWCQNVDNNYQWCGVENGDQCFCDSTTFGTGPNSASAGDCSSSCPGRGDHQCGGWWRIDLYKATGVSPGTATAAQSSAIPFETNSSISNSNHKGGLSGGSIAGIVLGTVAAVALLITALFLLVRRRRSRMTPSYTAGGREKTAATGRSTQANMHILQTPFESPRAELAGSESRPTLHQIYAGPS